MLCWQNNLTVLPIRAELSTCCRAGSRMGQAREPREGQNIKRLLSWLLASLRMGPPSVSCPGRRACLALTWTLAWTLACCVPSLHRWRTPASCLPPPRGPSEQSAALSLFSLAHLSTSYPVLFDIYTSREILPFRGFSVSSLIYPGLYTSH